MINRRGYPFSTWALLLLAAQSMGSFCIAEMEIKSVYHQFLKTEYFQRINEFFTGVENQGRRVIVRTQPDNREGEYFVLSLNQSVRSLPEIAEIKIEIFTSESANKKDYVLTLPPGRAKTRDIFAGITGGDWPGKEVKILAWRLTIQDADGRSIAKKESFLWKSP